MTTLDPIEKFQKDKIRGNEIQSSTIQPANLRSTLIAYNLFNSAATVPLGYTILAGQTLTVEAYIVSLINGYIPFLANYTLVPTNTSLTPIIYRAPISLVTTDRTRQFNQVWRTVIANNSGGPLTTNFVEEIIYIQTDSNPGLNITRTITIV